MENENTDPTPEEFAQAIGNAFRKLSRSVNDVLAEMADTVRVLTLASDAKPAIREIAGPDISAFARHAVGMGEAAQRVVGFVLPEPAATPTLQDRIAQIADFAQGPNDEYFGILADTVSDLRDEMKDAGAALSGAEADRIDSFRRRLIVLAASLNRLPK